MDQEFTVEFQNLNVNPVKPKRDRNKERMIKLENEEAATRYLKWMGYEIEARNWKCSAGEAHIVAREGDTIVFVEVEGASIDEGFPPEMLTPAKRSKWEAIAIAFLKEYTSEDLCIRFDFIGIISLDEEKKLIKHHVNTFGVMRDE